MTTIPLTGKPASNYLFSLLTCLAVMAMGVLILVFRNTLLADGVPMAVVIGFPIVCLLVGVFGARQFLQLWFARSEGDGDYAIRADQVGFYVPYSALHYQMIRSHETRRGDSVYIRWSDITRFKIYEYETRMENRMVEHAHFEVSVRDRNAGKSVDYHISRRALGDREPDFLGLVRQYVSVETAS